MAKLRGVQTINIIRARPGQEQLIEKMKVTCVFFFLSNYYYSMTLL
jgi:hypothetical protein